MPSIIIDGQKLDFEGNKTILQVALEHDIEIPHYCYHPGLSIVASCRICLAEIAQPNPRNDNKLEVVPKLVPTCQTPAADGTEVYLTSPKTLANQKAVMEYLLIHHPLDCPVCDQAGECYLQDYSFKYGRSFSRYDEAKIKQATKDVGPHVKLYSDRCIMCDRCVRFTKEVTGTGELGRFNRGNRAEIDTFPGKPLDNELSGNVVDICPVGALLDKDFLMSMRVWNLEKTNSIDGLTASGDNLSIEHNDGKIYRVKPRTNMDVNKWWISDEIRFGWKHVHSPDRLRTPTRKRQGAHEECDWNAAYAELISKFQQIVGEKGNGSLAVMVSPMLPCEEAHLLGKLALGLDPEATLAVGPVPVSGQDKTFPGGYTVHAEKAPNARGVRRALGLLVDAGRVLEYDAFVKKLQSGAIAGVLLTGNYPSAWATDALLAAVGQASYSGVIDILPSKITEQVDLVLPGATWTEKAGTFESANHRLQSFHKAIPVIELAKPEGQIALDLLAAAGLESRQRYNPKATRQAMGEAFVTDVHHPPISLRQYSDMQYVAL